jgi:hypothetical protein
MGLKQFLIKHDVDCKCGHASRQHVDSAGTCTAPDTRYLIKKTERSKACTCSTYRPGLLEMVFELF